MAKIDFTQNFEFKTIAQENLETIERQLAPILISEKTLIVERTQRGKDLHNKTFKKYRPATVAAKEKLGKQTSPPNLTDTGLMLSSLTSTVERIGNQIIGRIFSVGFAERVKQNADLGREFLGFDKQQVQRLKDKLSNLIKG